MKKTPSILSDYRSSPIVLAQPTRAYQYDSIGNRMEARDGVTAVTGTPNYTANNLNQYSVAAGVTLPTTPAPAPHDLDGNLCFDGGVNKNNEPREYVWDAENRLITVKRVSDEATLVSYIYDSQSRRIARTQGASTTLYLYDSFNCIAEYSISTGVSPTLQTTRLWGIDLSGTMQGAGGVGGMLSERHHSGTGTATSFYPTFDGNGNVSEYLAATGSPVAHFEYDPFGNTVVNTDTAGTFTYRFSTKPIDSVTGWFYYQYRYYDPQTGRWPSRDPIGEEGGVNLYAFVGNNGLNAWDFLGFQISVDDNDGKCCKNPRRDSKTGRFASLQALIDQVSKNLKFTPAGPGQTPKIDLKIALGIGNALGETAKVITDVDDLVKYARTITAAAAGKKCIDAEAAYTICLCKAEGDGIQECEHLKIAQDTICDLAAGIAEGLFNAN